MVLSVVVHFIRVSTSNRVVAMQICVAVGKKREKKVSDFNCFSSFESKRNFCAWSGSSV
jgi:hypothetical protein